MKEYIYKAKKLEALSSKIKSKIEKKKTPSFSQKIKELFIKK